VRKLVSGLTSGFCIIAIVLLCSMSMFAETVLTHLYTTAHGTEYITFLEERAAEFQKANPGVVVELVNGGGNLDKLRLMMAGGTPPDVVDQTLANAGVLASEGLLQSLNDFVTRDKFNFNNYPPFTRDALTMDGSIWGIPLDIIVTPTFFNVSMFEEAGLRTPVQLGENWTWDTLVSSARKLNADNDGDGKIDRYGLGMGGGMASRHAFVHQAGGQYFDNYKNPTKSLINTPAVATGLQWFSDLYNVHNVLPFTVYGAGSDLPTAKCAIDLASTLARIGMFNDGGN